MRGFARPSHRHELIMNYIGSLGYYSWHFAWVLLLVQLLLQVSQFFVVGQRIAIDATSTRPTEQMSADVHGVSLIGVALTGVLVFVCAVLLPYYVGKLSRKLPRYILSETSWPLTSKNLLRIKLFAGLAVVVVAVVCVFVPEGASGSNVGFIAVVVSACGAAVLFSLQHKLATLWRVPERQVF